MDADTPLHVSHDVSELLQNKLEALPHVERAFVHVDYEWEHIPVYRVIFLIVLAAEILFRSIGSESHFLHDPGIPRRPERDVSSYIHATSMSDLMRDSVPPCLQYKRYYVLLITDGGTHSGEIK